MLTFDLRQCTDYVHRCRWGTRGTCYVCCRRSCLVFVVSKLWWPCRAVIPNLHLHHPWSTTSIWVEHTWMCQSVRPWVGCMYVMTFCVTFWMCQSVRPWVGCMYVTTFCVTFLSVSHHIRMYVHCENRSSIQSLALMRSATIVPIKPAGGAALLKPNKGKTARWDYSVYSDIHAPLSFHVYTTQCATITHTYAHTHEWAHTFIYICIGDTHVRACISHTHTYICTYSVIDSDLTLSEWVCNSVGRFQ